MSGPGQSDDSQDDDDSQDGPNKRVIAWALALAALFYLTPALQDALEQAIYTGRAAALLQAMQDGASSLGITLPADYAPPQEELDALADGALAAAAGITATYAADLDRYALNWVERELENYGDINAPATTAAAADTLASDLADYVATRAESRAPLIATWECGQAEEAGLGILIDDSGTEVLGTTYDTLVGILPSYSSGDECADYAGEAFDLSEYDNLPFPAHYGCIHYKVLYRKSDYEAANAPDEADDVA